MKNLHILPTDKPSRLYLHSDNELQLRTNIIRTSEYYLGSNQHIYITSDEEIKEGDYVCASGGFRFVKTLNNDKGRTFKDDGIVSKQNPSSSCHLSNYKKIILTTDQDLIKDGVQAIDDEFLEWFVKNPSCESVEIDKNWNYPLDKSWEYKIIIPKEESKQETVEEEFKFKNRQMGAAGFVGNKIMENMISKFKQETLEEVAHEMLVDYGIKSIGQSIGVPTVKKLMVNMAKWQQERMYSEEEVQIILSKLLFDLKHKGISNSVEWFEQFKKK